MYLIDTNIISEVRKGSRCNQRVAAWYDGIGDDELYLSVILIGEIRQGIERVRKRDPRHAIVLENWLSEVIQTFDARILPIDRAVAERLGASYRDRNFSGG